MNWVGEWSPLIATVVVWVLFLFLLRDFRDERFRADEERIQHLKRHADLLERIAIALENAIKKSS